MFSTSLRIVEVESWKREVGDVPYVPTCPGDTRLCQESGFVAGSFEGVGACGRNCLASTWNRVRAPRVRKVG